MGRFILRRLVQAVPTFFGILIITFALTRFSPSDPVKLMLAGQQDITAEDRAALYVTLGLDQPIYVQFATYVVKIVQLDFGNSFNYHRPVVQLLAERIPNSLQLSIFALIFSLGIGVPLGIISALRRGKATDHAIRIGSVIVHAVPTFWFGLLVVLVLGVQLRWLPVGSMNTVGKEGDFIDRLYHMAGPMLVLALGGLSFYPRLLRTETLEVLAQDYVRTAHSKGLRTQVVMIVHVLRNALIPVVTSLGGILTIFLSGALIVEQIFNWPGLGRLGFEAALNKDYPLLQAVVVAGSVLLMISYILRDITYALVDPRIKVR